MRARGRNVPVGLFSDTCVFRARFAANLGVDAISSARSMSSVRILIQSTLCASVPPGINTAPRERECGGIPRD